MGNGYDPEPVMDIPPCTHGDDDAVHAEVFAWAEAWAKKIHAETPFGADRCVYETERLWRDEVFQNAPPHFRQCGLRLKNHIKDALLDIHKGAPINQSSAT